MKFTIAVLSNVLFTSTALAVPSPGLARRMARRAAGRSGQPLQRVIDSVNAGNETNVEYSSNWSGAVITSPPSGQTFNGVSATFTVPTPSVPSGVSATDGEYAASAWVGIDGDTYDTAILQTGIDFVVSTSGEVSYDAWYEWYPDYAYDFSLDVSAGDVISISVASTSSEAGTAVIENVTTGKTVTKSLTSSSALGGQNAEWIVEDFEENGSLIAFANFGTVTFTDAVATTSSSSEGPSSATIIDLENSSGNVLTSVSVGSSEVTVTYV